MSRKGLYLGGGTTIGRHSSGWFKNGSTVALANYEGTTIRTDAEKAELLAFTFGPAYSETRLIKKDEEKRRTRKKGRPRISK